MTHAVKVSEKPLVLTEHEIITLLVHEATQHNYAVAVWQLPNTPVKNLLIAREALPQTKDVALENLASGYLFAPFDTTQQRYFLQADYLFSFSNGVLDETATPPASQQWLEELLSASPLSHGKPYYTSNHIFSASSEATSYLSLVQKSIEHIEAGVFEKIVPSRVKHVILPETFDVVETFQKLCEAYPIAMVSFISIPSVGTWMGASPEILIQVENNHIFKTVALAGTKRYEAGTNLKNVAWTQKEIEEQALVSRYIISHLKKIRLREFDEHGPKTIVAGNVMHLKTEFTIDMQATGFPQLGTIMLQLLHPTSAVCGMPLEPSLEFLKNNEGYNREFYAGYLGPVNINNTINLFVNLRCMQVFDTHAIVYAGAGVTADSVPENEWEETEVKLNTLLNVIL
jgi:isochorismate synthase